MRAFVVLLLLGGFTTSCAEETGRLTADQEQRLAAETIVRRANNLMFHHTRGAGARWEDMRASIVVTHGTILIHRNGEIEFLLKPSSRRGCEVHLDHDRIRINAGSGQSAEVWSFEPPDQASAWTTDIRSTIRATNSVSK